MQYVLTGSEMSACDARTSNVIGIPSLVLMERAALSVADGADDYLKKCGKAGGRVLVAAGRGNNGADGLAAGRILLDRDYKVQFLRLSGEVSPGSSFGVQEQILTHYGAEVEVFSEDFCFPEESGNRREIPDVVIDGLFGTGLSRELKGQAAGAVSLINRYKNEFGSYVIAVDIPSGISSDDGRVMGCAAECNETRTFAFLKRGHLMYPGASYAGTVHLADIGITSRAFEDRPGMFTRSGERAEDLLPPRDSGGNKGTFGKVLLVAGQQNMCGAALLAGGACLSSGAGMVKIFTHEANRVIVQTQLPEALLETYTDSEPADEINAKLRASLDWADIAAAGPGMGTGNTAKEILRTILDYGLSALDGIVLDADALRLLAADPALKKALSGRPPCLPCILTPHLAEFAALAGHSVSECAARRSELVQETADALHCTIACKDARTLVTSPFTKERGMQYLNRSGNSGMATAGSGDVLTGMTAACLASFCRSKESFANTFFSDIQRADGFEAAVCAVCLHGIAGDIARDLYGERGMKAGDLITVLRNPAFFQ